jgi:hypothetical protein
LIALAFILPSAAVFANTDTGESTEIIDASEYNSKTIFSDRATPAIETIDERSTDPIASLDWNNGWPVEVDSINIGSPIASGEYDIEATFCRPDYQASTPEILVYSDGIGDVYISSDCDTVTIRFESFVGEFWVFDLFTQGGNNFDANSPEASGKGTKKPYLYHRSR